MKYQTSLVAPLMLLGSVCVQADTIDAGDIGVALTAAGSPVAADGPIPAYEGRGVLAAGWTPGQNRQASWKYRAEQPLYTIDASSYEKHADQLTAGQQALFKANPEYKMDVYPSHRSCAYPDFVLDNTRSNVSQARLSADQNGLASGALPGLPFPGTRDGLQAIWNHLLRYTGTGYDVPMARTLVSPRPGSNTWIETVTDATMFFPLNKQGTNAATDFGGTYQALFVSYLRPTALVGQALVQSSVFSADQDTYMYFPGQRRVRRMPTYAYDAPILNYENQMMVDASYTFNGNPDRFDWKFVGEKNMLLPYNSFAMYDNELKLSEVAQQNAVAQKARRYEQHRTYVVEATVKEGLRHSAPRRTFYFDADTYLAVMADDYDAQGNIWRVRESYPMPVHELQGTCTMVTHTQYDLQSGRYVMDFVTAETPSNKAFQFYLDSSAPRYKMNFYTQDNLRALSER